LLTKCKSRRLAGDKRPLRPPEKPFAYFLEIPRRDFLDLEKGVSGGAPALKCRDGGAQSV